MNQASWMSPLCLVAIQLVAGCSNGARDIQIAERHGVVLLDDKPLQDGVVVLESPSTGFAACSTLDEHGRFSIDRIPAGMYYVVVKPPELTPPGETPIPRPSHYGALRLPPKKYHSIATSDISVAVNSGSQADLEIVLDK